MRIAVAGLHQPGSGLTRVLAEIAGGLTRPEHDLVLLGFEPGRARPGSGELRDAPIALLPCPGMRFAIPPATLDRVMSSVDLLLLHGPAFLYEGTLRVIAHHARRDAVRVILYLPTEGTVARPAILDAIGDVDDCILYTPGAMADLAALIDARRAAHPGWRGPRLHVAGHGVDAERFGPSVERTDAAARHRARATFWDATDPDETCVLVVARDHRRKRIDLAIDGFAIAAGKRPGARLVLHAGPDAARVAAVAAASPARDRISVLSAEVMSDKRLGLLYNACEIGLSTAMGEGWGLPLLEHAATGAAIVAPDHTSFRDNWAGAATLMPCPEAVPVFFEFSEMHATKPQLVADALHPVLADPGATAALGRLARDRALEPRFRWPAVVAAIADVIHQGEPR